MKIIKNNYFILIFLSSSISLFFYKILEDDISNNLEAMIAAAGFLVAASWGWLQNETNKEIKIRDEVINLISDYERSIISYLEECNIYVSYFFSYYHFTKRIDEEIFRAKSKVEKGNEVDVEKLREDFGGNRIFERFEVIRNQSNICVTKRNIVALKGELIKKYVSSKEVVEDIDDKCKVSLEKICKSSDASNIGSKEPKIDLDGLIFEHILRGLSVILDEKVKGFDTRSKKYKQAANACIFFTTFGFFLFFWSLISI